MSYFLGVYMAWFFLSRNYWSLLDHDLMASIWEKVISILTGNLNSGCSYSITAATISETDYSIQICRNKFLIHSLINTAYLSYLSSLLLGLGLIQNFCKSWYFQLYPLKNASLSLGIILESKTSLKSRSVPEE